MEKTLTITDLTRRIQDLLEGQLGPMWVSGEVSNLRHQSSGHVYFSLKDAESTLAAVMFRGDAVKQALVALKDGAQVLVYGRLSVYAAKGNYQFVVRTVQMQGQGRLQLEFERLKRQLHSEGLFDPARKRKIPTLPRRIGVITSPTGAALQDFLSILKRRGFAGEIYVFSAKVQGQGAAASLIAQLEYAQSFPLDLVVLTRGGGSLEDLWCFNEERLVRAVAACRYPTLSAVGHEIDFSLCDFAADARAETPSGAAELISSSTLALRERHRQVKKRLAHLCALFFERKQQRLERVQRALLNMTPSRRIERHYLRLDEYTLRLESAINGSLRTKKLQLLRLQERLRRLPLKQQLGGYYGRMKYVKSKLHAASMQGLKALAQQLVALQLRLHNVSQPATLQRGYALMTTLDAQPVSSAQGTSQATCLRAQWADGAWIVHTINRE